jgi:hypothetical protein
MSSKDPYVRTHVGSILIMPVKKYPAQHLGYFVTSDSRGNNG